MQFRFVRLCRPLLLGLFCCLVLCSGCTGPELAGETAAYTWGRADAKEIDVNSKIAGRVVSLLVKEGDAVEKGQVMARIDQRDLLARKEQLMASIEAIRAQQKQATWSTAMGRGISEAALGEAKAAAERAKSNLDFARADYERYAYLLDSDAISRQIFEQAKTSYQSAEASYYQAQAGISQATAALMQTDVNLANENTLARQLEQAEATLKQLMISLDETEIRAPFSGIVTAKYVEEGSMISLGTPLVAVQDPMDNWVNFKIPETELKHFRLGEQVSLVARDGETSVTGYVTDISQKSEFATHRATSERGDDTDIISFNVKIKVDNEALRPGMRFRLVEEGL